MLHYFSKLLCVVVYLYYLCVCVCVCAWSCPTFCDPMDCSPPGSSAQGLPRKEHWSGLPFPSPGDLPNLSIETASLVSLCVICQDLKVICSFFFFFCFKLVFTFVPNFILIIFISLFNVVSPKLHMLEAHANWKPPGSRLLGYRSCLLLGLVY